MSRSTAIAEQLSGINMQAHETTKHRVREPLLLAMEEAIEKDFSAGGGI